MRHALAKLVPRGLDARSDNLSNARFGLIRYFVLTSFIAFAIVGAALIALQHMEEEFFAQVQRTQNDFLAGVQSEFARKQDEAARASLLASHEAAHVNLTRVLANVLWASDFAPFVAHAQQLPVDHCHAFPRRESGSRSQGADPRNECFTELGHAIMSLPGFAELDAKAHEAMRASSVFKIKVFDLRGITVYSSEHGQIGDDKADNLGWITAAAGQPASEMTHRDRFSAFEGVVENRDLISSYLPVRTPGSDTVIGVFEIYSDVTMFLDRIRAISSDANALAAANQQIVEQTALENQRKVGASSVRFLMIIGGLLVLLYLALLWLVRNGQRIIDRQGLAQERAAEREERWYREKMAALATMAANVSHEVGNPLAVITMLAQDIQNQKAKTGCEKCHPQEILEQARRIAGMTRNITDFAAARRDRIQLIDVNQTLKAMLDFLSFDQHFGALQVEFRPDADLPAHEVVPDHLNEALLNLLQTSADCFDQQDGVLGHMIIETEASADGIVIRVACEGHDPGELNARPDPFQDSRFDVVRRRVADMGGEVRASATMVEITLPTAPAHPVR